MVDDQDLARKLSWLMAIRVLVIASILLPTVVYSPNDDDNGLISSFLSAFGQDPVTTPVISSLRARILQVLVGTVSLQTLIYVGLLRVLRQRQAFHAYIQLVGDLVLISLLLYKFGSNTANISVLYFLIIGVAAFLVRREASLIVAAFASLLYGAVMVGHQSEAFRSIWYEGKTARAVSAETPGWRARVVQALRPAEQDDIPGVPLTYNLTVHLAGFLTVALFSKRLARDTTLEERLAQRSRDLQRLQVLHRDVIQSISSGLITTDLVGRVTSVNRAAEEILGTRESLLQASDIRNAKIFTESAWHVSCQKVLSEGQVRSEVEVWRDGKPQVLGFTITTLRDGSGAHRGYLVIFQDLTGWRSLEEKVRLQEKMAAIGQMAAGLAHEVGNPLAAIAGSVQMLAGRPGKEMAERKLLDITLRESRRLDRIVKSFLQFAKPRERDLRRFDIALLLAEDCALLENSDELNDHHQLDLTVEPPSVEIEADRDQIAQIFWNLVRNALQAMPEGGKLTVAGRLVGDRFAMTVQDSGRGMSDEERDKLFQPFKSFFDSGIGLGMAIVYRIVEEHGGEIQVDSQLGQGTKITVMLPLRSSPATAEPSRPDLAAPLERARV